MNGSWTKVKTICNLGNEGSDPGGELDECGEWVARDTARATVKV